MTATLRGAPLVAIDAHEGPTYLPEEDALYVTAVPRRRRRRPPRALVKRIDLASRDVTVVATGTVMPNGMTRDLDGTVLICEQGDRYHDARIARFDPRTRATSTVVDAFCGLPLNSPNDVRVRRDGSIWFTDPSYGHLQGFRPRPRLRDAVYRFDPASGTMTVVVDCLDKPNGLAFSPDESVLYVTDSGTNTVCAVEHGHPRVLFVPAAGAPDGIAVDAAGRVYACAADGVHVLDPDGQETEFIDLPGSINLTFGGPDNDRLFITADTAVHEVVLTREGA